MENLLSSNDMHPRSFEIVKSVERKAEDLLTDRYSLIELDKKRQKAREALRAVKQLKSNEKQWLCLGSTFVKFSKESALKVLEKDFEEVEKEIEKTRKSMKEKYSELCDLEKRKEVSGFQLVPLSANDRRMLETDLHGNS